MDLNISLWLLIVRPDIIFSVILCNEDITETYKLSNISLEHNAIFDKYYATAIGDFMLE